MVGLRDPFRYREDAAHFRKMAAAATDSRSCATAIWPWQMSSSGWLMSSNRVPKGHRRAYIAGMADKPAPKADDSYSEEETARRRVRAGDDRDEAAASSN